MLRRGFRRLVRARGRGWVSRLLDAALWLALWLPPASEAALSPYGRAKVVAAAAAPLLAAAVAVGRRWPLTALGAPVALSLALSATMYTPLYWPALAVFGFLAGCRTAAARPVLWFLGSVAVAGIPLCVVVVRDLWAWTGLLLTLLGAAGLPWLLGRYRRQYAELVRLGWRLADRMEREQRVVAERTRSRERARIAGDMHDSLGHELTLIAVRAAALEVDATLAPHQQRAAGELREAAGTATARLREIIGVLRADEEEGDRPATAPSGESAETLVERARAAGLDVTLERRGEPAGLPPMAGLAVHRVLQEGLTNAAKHAPGAAVRVRLVRTEDPPAVALTIVNSPAAAAPLPGVDSGGSGLVGLDERVRLAGGVLRAGPVPDGGFELAAELPATAAPTPRAATDASQLTTSGRELTRARRRVRRQLTQAVVAPVAALAGILLLTFPVSVVSSYLSVMDRSTYDRLAVGTPRDDVTPRLPLFTRDGPPDDSPAPPRGQDCAYYSTRLMSGDAYRLCFAGDRLVSKTVVKSES
ncbi:sensor histidine kinase [Streptomyces coffeae]|uniref:histidine kinase n=1 Tax=Streptomyces coffeae TaxID=621382 RepID=A0ABS1N7Q4_9ACTN|nr:histidine kinase [Streptomyces coffeae]MBL1096109.1 sensor histidine kinase [Streptomyces coffeae]